MSSFNTDIPYLQYLQSKEHESYNKYLKARTFISSLLYDSIITKTILELIFSSFLAISNLFSNIALSVIFRQASFKARTRCDLL